MKLNINTKIGGVFLIFLLEVLSLFFVYDVFNKEHEYYVDELREEMLELKLINQLQAALGQISGKEGLKKQHFEVLSTKVESLIGVLDLWRFNAAQEAEAFKKTKEDYFKFKDAASKMPVILSLTENNYAGQLIEDVGKFYSAAERQASKINAGQDKVKNKINKVMAIGILFNIALIFCAIVYFRLTISRPLINLKSAAFEVGKGNFDKKVNIKLNDEIGELGAVFNKMTEGLKVAQAQLIMAEKMELVSKLARGVAHEVKNPLAVIMQGADYLSACSFAKDEVCSLAINGITEAAKKADTTINGLLEFASTRKLDIKLLDINSIIENSLLLVKYQLEKSNITVNTELKKDAPNILADKNKIEQVFLNFLANAIESMPDGGQLKIRTYTEERTGVIDDPHYKKEANLKFMEQLEVAEIEDTGYGLPEDVIHKIFTPFFSTKGDEGGASLGLWIVRNIVEMHNAKMKIENNKDSKGKKVTLIFKVEGYK